MYIVYVDNVLLIKFLSFTFICLLPSTTDTIITDEY